MRSKINLPAAAVQAYMRTAAGHTQSVRPSHPCFSCFRSPASTHSSTTPQILSNAVLLVDKPARWSSADVVRQLKAALKVDKVCFGAPLDTEATGLLIILLGEARDPAAEHYCRAAASTRAQHLASLARDADAVRDKPPTYVCPRHVLDQCLRVTPIILWC
jgi:hypothetical protein